MSSRNHQLRRSRLRKEKKKKQQTKKKRKPSRLPLIEPKPHQSKLSKRWIREAPQKGRLSKLEAIHKLQDEAEAGNDVGRSTESLAKLITDHDREVALSAAWAAGICASIGANPMHIIPPIIGLLQSEDDLTVETAIETLGECAKNKNHLARKMLFAKLAAINKDGASDQTKADAGFALSEVISCANNTLLNKELRRIANSMFSSLSESRDEQCKVAGITGFCFMGIAFAQLGKPDEAIRCLKMVPINSSRLIHEVVFNSYNFAEKHLPSQKLPELYNSAVVLLFGAPDFDSHVLARDFIIDRLEQPAHRIPLINTLAHWEVRAMTAISQHFIAKEALARLEQGCKPEEICSQMSFENELQRKWMEDTIRLGRKNKELKKVLEANILTRDQETLALIKTNCLGYLRECGLNLAKSEKSHLLTRYLFPG
jgi:hypothetical protein